MCLGSGGAPLNGDDPAPLNGDDPAWYARLPLSRTFSGETYPLTLPRPDVLVKPKLPWGPFRNPLIFARELQAEMIRHNLTRVQLGQRHSITSDRITQWLCLLKLPEEKQREIEALGDHWDRRLVTERELRKTGRKNP